MRCKRINHSLKVLSFAHLIADCESYDGLFETIIYSAILHDIGIKEAEKKYNSSAVNYQGIEGPIIAGRILKELKLDDEIIDRVCFIIGNHHSYQEIDGLDFQIVVEADFLVNIYEDQLHQDAIESIYHHLFRPIPVNNY